MRIPKPEGPRQRQRPAAARPRPAGAPAPLPRLDDAEWERLCGQEPDLVARLRQGLTELAGGRRVWAELLAIPDAELLGMAKLGAANMDLKRYAEAESVFAALCLLDPYVPWFWLSLGDARMRLCKTAEAIEALSRCIQATSGHEPPLEECRPASYRRGTLYVRTGQFEEAFEDFKRVLQLDTQQVSDGERAWLAIQQLAQEGKIPSAWLDTLPKPT
jgi:tetratricopeptide (TPR) repeat protein